MTSIDEVIAHAREVAKRNREQWKNCTADRRDIEHQTCEQCAEEHEQLAEWLEELKTIKEMDLSIPQHFTKEQSGWIKTYCIKRNIEFYNKAIDDFVNALQGKIEKDLANPDLALECKKCGIWKNYDIKEIAEQLKESD